MHSTHGNSSTRACCTSPHQSCAWSRWRTDSLQALVWMWQCVEEHFHSSSFCRVMMMTYICFDITIVKKWLTLCFLFFCLSLSLSYSLLILHSIYVYTGMAWWTYFVFSSLHLLLGSDPLLWETESRRARTPYGESEGCNYGDVPGNDDISSGIQYFFLAFVHSLAFP